MARFLLIEDTPDMAKLIIRVLERGGHSVVVSPDGLGGVQIMYRDPVDLVLLDLQLPDLDGHMIATLLRRLPQPVPIVAITANSDKMLHQRALNAGCVDVIMKPIDRETFVPQLEGYLRGPGAHTIT